MDALRASLVEKRPPRAWNLACGANADIVMGFLGALNGPFQ
jgi:hypothetical protein